jgi:hypothetical protein
MSLFEHVFEVDYQIRQSPTRTADLAFIAASSANQKESILRPAKRAVNSEDDLCPAFFQPDEFLDEVCVLEFELHAPLS